MDESLCFSPPLFDFGTIFVSGRHHVKSMTIHNKYTKTVSISFQGLSDLFSLIKANDMKEQQVATGFDVFAMGTKISSILIPPKGYKKIFGVLNPCSDLQKVHDISGRITANCYAIDGMTTSDDEYAEFEPDEDEVPWKMFQIDYEAHTIAPSISVTPQTCYLDDCCKDQAISTKFYIKNTSDIEISLLGYTPTEISLTSQKNTHYFSLQPNEGATFELTYIPKQTGQFDYKVEFACTNPYIPPFFFRLLTSVSPAKTPTDFPQVTPTMISFGNMRTSDSQEVTLSISNPSNSDYTVTIRSYSEVSKLEPLLFKTALRSQLESTTTIVLSAQTSRTIFINYSPEYNEKASKTAFEKRVFLITLIFTLTLDGSTFYRRVPVSANICHSTIATATNSINFGDMTVTREPKHASIILKNLSPMPTTVSATSSSRWVALSSSKVELGASQTTEFPFTFYPYKVCPNFESYIIFRNEHNSLNTVEASVSAAVLAENDEIAHANYFSLISDQKAVYSLDFSFVPVHFPSIRQLTIKNTSKSTISLSIRSSSPQLQVFQENLEYYPLVKSPSASSFASTQSVEPSFNTISKEPVTMKQLEKMMHSDHKFFDNMLIYGAPNSEEDIVANFEWKLSEYTRMLNSSLVNIADKPLVIEQGHRVDLWVVLIPCSKDRVFLWKAGAESLIFNLLSLSGKLQPYVLPVKFAYAASYSFITSHNFNYGNLVRKTVKENQIFLSNESALPLLYRIETNETDAHVSVLKNQVGIVAPFDSRSIPVRFETPFEGKVNDIVKIRNILNPLDIQKMEFKAQVELRAGFYIDTLDIDFGEVTFGSSAVAKIYILNKREEESEYIFSHFHRDNSSCKPMISFQYMNMSESHLTAALALRIEMQHRKLLCLLRKNKTKQAEKVQKVIDNLRKQGTPNESAQKRSTAKSIDRCCLQSGPLQTHCLSIQFIPSLKSKRKLDSPVKIEGIISVSEDNRTNTNKDIRYRAIVKPQYIHSFDETGDKNISISPNELDLGTVFVQTCTSSQIEVTNLSKSSQTHFWVSSDTSDDAIVSFGINEGEISPGQTVTIPIDFFCTLVGKIQKYVTITTPTTQITCNVQFEAIYQNVLEFPSLPLQKVINFGAIALTSYTKIEERRSFDLTNVSDSILYLLITNVEKSHIVLYEHDPHFPILNTLCLEPGKTLNVNIRLKPVIDIDEFKKYLTFALNDCIMISAYNDQDDASNAVLHRAETNGCIFHTEIQVKALIGRVGIALSNKIINFGSVEKVPQERYITIKNRSSLIPLDILCGCSQGLTVEPSRFTILGTKESTEPQEIKVTFKPTVDGLNTGKLLFTAVSTNLQFEIEVIAFVDPKYIEINLPLNELGYYNLDVGDIYLNNEKPIPKQVSFVIKNISKMHLSGEIPELNKNYMIKPGATYEVSFKAPFEGQLDDDEKMFRIPIYLKGKLTKGIQHIVEITGKYIVSIASSTSSVNLGTLIKTEDLSNISFSFIVVNTTRGELYLKMKKDSQHFNVPKIIGPVGQMDSITVKGSLFLDEIQKIQTSVPQCFHIVYVNPNNSANEIDIPVYYKVLKQYISTDIDKNLFIHQFREVNVGSHNVWTCSCLFTIRNELEDEISSTIVVSEDLPEEAHVMVLKRNAETKLETITMQPEDSLELRVKVTLIGTNSVKDTKHPVQLGTIYFQNPNYSPSFINIVFSPKEKNGEIEEI